MIISIVASVLASIADVMILYSPNGGYHTMDYLFLRDVPYQRLVIGHFLGILTIPAYLLGFWWVSRALAPLGKHIPGRAFGVAIFILILGVTYHASVGMIWLLANDLEHSTELLAKGRIFFEPISNILIVLVMIFSTWLGAWIYQQKTMFPRWMVWFLPVFPFLLFVACYLIIPVIGNVLIPAGFNITIGIFLLASFLALKDQDLIGN